MVTDALTPHSRLSLTLKHRLSLHAIPQLPRGAPVRLQSRLQLGGFLTTSEGDEGEQEAGDLASLSAVYERLRTGW